MDTSLGTFCIIFGAFFQFTNAQPSFSLHPPPYPPTIANSVGRACPQFAICSEFQLCIGWVRELRESFEKDALL